VTVNSSITPQIQALRARVYAALLELDAAGRQAGTEWDTDVYQHALSRAISASLTSKAVLRDALLRAERKRGTSGMVGARRELR
jgi:hypothetical protein